MQTSRRLPFHGLSEGIALNVVSQQWAIEDAHAGADRDQKKNRDDGKEDNYFVSQGSKVTSLQCYRTRLCNSDNFRSFNKSLGFARHS